MVDDLISNMNEKNSYPRVLIVNQQSIKKNNATGITLRSLWEEWPLDKYMEVYLDQYETQVDYKCEFRSICLPSNWLNRIAHCGSAKRINSGIKHQELKPNNSFLYNIRQGIVLILDMILSVVPSSVRFQLDSFSPEIIYTLGASVSALDLAYRLSKRYKAPIIIHYMDNWPESLQWDTNPFIKPYRKVLDTKLNRCNKRSVMGLAISPQMADAYSIKFNMPFTSIMNSVDVNSFHLEAKIQGNPLKFVYAGGLHLNRWKALLDISKAFIQEGINAELHIYTSKEYTESYRSLFNDNTFFHEPVDHSEISKVYQDADVLVHVESDNPMLLGFFKYSISTKIPEYLASGRIILFYGPKELGLFKYLRDNMAAYTAGDYDELCENLAVINSSKKNDIILQNAMKVAQDNHNTKNTRLILKNTINSCVEGYKYPINSKGRAEWA